MCTTSLSCGLPRWDGKVVPRKKLRLGGVFCSLPNPSLRDKPLSMPLLQETRT